MDRHQPSTADVATNATEAGVFKKIGNVLRRPEGKIIETALVVGIGISALAGCAPDEAPKPTTTQSQEATPEPETPAPEPTETKPATEMPDRYDFGVPYSEIQALEPLTPAEISAQNDATRAHYALGMAQKFDLAGFANSYYSISGDFADINLPAAVGEENTPEQAWAFISSMRGMSLTITDGVNRTLDGQTARKVIATTFLEGANSSGYRNLDAYINELGGDSQIAGTGRTLAASSAGGVPTVNSASELYKDSAGLTCRDTNVTDRVHTEDITICLIGEPGRQIWATKEFN